MPRPDYTIISAKVVGPHKLQLTFADGTVGDVGFNAEELTGVFAPLADPAYFVTVSVDPEMGTVVWPNGADMAPDGLYDEVKAAAGAA